MFQLLEFQYLDKDKIMDKRIIYKNTDGTIAIIIPANCGLTVEQIAKKDVPTGLKYKIVNASEISVI